MKVKRLMAGLLCGSLGAMLSLAAVAQRTAV